MLLTGHNNDFEGNSMDNHFSHQSLAPASDPVYELSSEAYPSLESPDSAPQSAVALIDRNGFIKETSAAMRGLLGYPDDNDLIGHHYAHFFTVLDRSATATLQSRLEDLNPIIRCINQGESYLNVLGFIPGTEAGAPLFGGTLAPVYGPGRKVSGALLIATVAEPQSAIGRWSRQTDY